MKLPFFKNSKGQTLVQALVSIGISAIVLAAMIGATVTMMKSNKLLAQKLEVLDLKNQLQSTFANPENCTCQLNSTMNTANAENLQFDSTHVGSMNLRSLRQSCVATSLPLAEENQLLPGTQTSLKVKSVELVKIERTGNVEEYLGLIRITFDEGSLAGPLAPLQIRQKFYGDPASPAVNKVVLGCQSDFGVKVASGNGVLGTNNKGNVTIDLQTYGFDPLGPDPHIIVSERDSNYDQVDGNTMDASFCGFDRESKLVFKVTCWASPNDSDGLIRSSFDWLALQK